MFNKTTEDITIKSTPPNAKILIDGKKFGTTPQKVNIERGANHVIKLELPEYDPYEIQITRKLSSWVWANAANFFIPGFTIDYLNGSMYYLVPDALDVALTPTPVIEKPKKK
jgi:hypothetical protein